MQRLPRAQAQAQVQGLPRPQALGPTSVICGLTLPTSGEPSLQGMQVCPTPPLARHGTRALQHEAGAAAVVPTRMMG